MSKLTKRATFVITFFRKSKQKTLKFCHLKVYSSSSFSLYSNNKLLHCCSIIFGINSLTASLSLLKYSNNCGIKNLKK